MATFNQKRVLIRHYPVGAEMTISQKRDWSYHERVATKRGEQNEESIRAAVSRARATVLRKCLAIGARRMLTLTMPGANFWNEQPIDEAWRMFSLWVKRLSRNGYTFKYVAVPERQNRGAWHFHVAVDQYLPVQTLQSKWTSVGGGNLDVKHFVAYPHSTAEEGCAVYIGKYIGKELGAAEFGRRRFRASKGIKIDIERVDLDPLFVSSVPKIKNTFNDMTGKTAGTLSLYKHVHVVVSWGNCLNDYRYGFPDSSETHSFASR